MKLILAFIIFALAFNGYSAAAHAFMQGDCDPASMSKMTEKNMDMSGCLGHKSDKKAKKDIAPSKESKAKCMDCTHCCISHAIFQQNYTISSPPLARTLISSVNNDQSRDSLFSLLRPPRTLV